MTDEMLRDLLEERVADVTSRDLSGAAWRSGRRTRRRDRLAVVGAAALVTAVVATGTAVLGDGGPTGPSPAPGVPTVSQSTTSGDEPDATYEGVPVYWSLAQEQEGNLPYVASSPLPQVIDLGDPPAPEAGVVARAVVAFWVDGGVVLVDEAGNQSSVDVSGLDSLTKVNGYGYRPVHQSMLSPSGRYLVFPQDDAVKVFSLASRQWRTIEVGAAETRDVTWSRADRILLPQAGPWSAGPTWTVEGKPLGDDATAALHRPGFDTLDAQAYGLARSAGGAVAQSWGMGVPVPVADTGQYLSDPEFISARAGGEEAVLSIQWNVRDEDHGGRFLQCCPVAGWLDDRTLVYESRQTDPALVAWTVGTDDFGLVSTIKGRYLLASFADLDR